jgi:hypothetical protein
MARPTELIAIYQCNQASGTTLIDMLGVWDRTLSASPDWSTDGYSSYTHGWNPKNTSNAWSPAASFPSGVNFNNGFTIAFWVYPTSTDTGAIVRFASNHILTLNNHRVGVEGNKTWGDDGLLTADTWSHVAYTLSSGTITAYINGESIGTVSWFPSGTFTLGAYNDTYRYPGTLSDIHIWNKACTQSEIENCMNQYYSNTGNSYYYQQQQM